MKIMVSACLAGENCKYNGGNNRNEKVMALLAAERGANLIGQVLGEDVDIDIAQGIFDRFCVGK